MKEKFSKWKKFLNSRGEFVAYFLEVVESTIKALAMVMKLLAKVAKHEM